MMEFMNMDYKILIFRMNQSIRDADGPPNKKLVSEGWMIG